MSRLRITGRENIAARAEFYLPNRIDEPTLAELDKQLGGADKLAFMVEEVLLPDERVMRYIRSGNRRVLSFNFRRSNVRDLREKLLGLMREGYSVLFVPGRPVSILGCIADVPMPFMMQLAALHISPTPIFVGYYRNSPVRTFTSDPADYDFARIIICPKLAPGPLTGDRALEAWLLASSQAYDEHPILKKSLARLLVEGIRSHPNVELIDGMDDTRVPYYKILGVAMALARHLRKTVREPRLGILLPPGKGGMIANYACLLAGIVPVNINYTSSEDSFRSIVRQSGIRHFISAHAFMSKLPQFPWPPDDQIIHLDRTLRSIGMAKIAAWVLFAKAAPMPLVAMTFKLDARKDGDEAALLFTSGSSGEPKGVTIPHRGVLLFARWAEETFGWGPETVIANQAPLYFDVSVMDVYGAMRCGGKLILTPEVLFRFPVKLPEFLRENGVTSIYWVPTVMINIANSGVLESVELPELRSVAFAGEVMPNLQLNIWRRALPGRIFANLYGPTETDVCTAYVVDREFSDTEPLPIGKPLPDMRVLLIGEDGRPVPRGETGEICVAGSGVNIGYWNQPELTERAFYVNPEGLPYAPRYYRTGDLGWYNERGELMFAGRRDGQIKLRGNRIELGEIENAARMVEGTENVCALFDVAQKLVRLRRNDKVARRFHRVLRAFVLVILRIRGVNSFDYVLVLICDQVSETRKDHEEDHHGHDKRKAGGKGVKLFLLLQLRLFLPQKLRLVCVLFLQLGKFGLQAPHRLALLALGDLLPNIERGQYKSQNNGKDYYRHAEGGQFFVELNEPLSDKVIGQSRREHHHKIHLAFPL